MQHLEVRPHTPDEAIGDKCFFAHHVCAHNGLPTTTPRKRAEAFEYAGCGAIAVMFRLTVFAFEHPATGEHRGDFLTRKAKPQSALLQQVILVGTVEEFFANSFADTRRERNTPIRLYGQSSACSADMTVNAPSAFFQSVSSPIRRVLTPS